MRTVTVTYHFEDDRWWAETDDLPEFVAGADTFESARGLVQEGLEFNLDEAVEVDERFDPAAIEARRQALTTVTTFGGLVASLLSPTSAQTGGVAPVPVAVHRPPAEVPRAAQHAAEHVASS